MQSSKEHLSLNYKGFYRIITKPFILYKISVKSLNYQVKASFLLHILVNQQACTDKNNHVIYRSDGGEAMSPENIIFSGDDVIKHNGIKYSIHYDNLSITDWNFYMYMPTKQITSSANIISITVISVITICFFIVYFTSKIFSKKIVYDIERLRQNMDLVESGVMEITVESKSQDEIGNLIQNFGKMVNQIDNLIQEVYISKIKEKEFELKALQSQINPHFLYNSLSVINWRAIKIDAYDISEMAQLLSSFYRTSLNKAKTLTLISNEIINIESYVKIQLILHQNNFNVEYHICDGIDHFCMPNLMLQPLIENAIVHGIENKENGVGLIIISCEKINNDFLFRVEDNGIGISEVRLKIFLDEQSEGYGVKNVNDRAKLLYGKKYGLTVESIENEYTVFSLLLPQIEADLRD